MSKYAIEINKLSFTYDESNILDEVSTAFPSGSFSVLLGRNGSGKSTLFNIIAGLEKYQQGSVKLMGKERKQLSYKHCATILGFLPQFHKTVFPFKVKDVVITGRAAFSSYLPSKQDKMMVDQAIDELGILHLADKPYTELSGGERQLVMIARVLVQNPQIIMLDEPTNHLDLHYQTYVLDKLRLLARRGYTIITVMHDPNLAVLYGDQYFFMKEKKVFMTHEEPNVQIRHLFEELYDVKLIDVPVKNKTVVVPDF
jgi:iron complex transport system ATP-binding protein